MSQFKALVVSENAEKQYVRTITQRNIEDLPAGEVLIKVHYSTLNYKDALSSIGNKGVTRNYPHTPGIDASVSWLKVPMLIFRLDKKY
jgi:NADPH:quinone reductase-like Zn-dependent oxidoreductase